MMNTRVIIGVVAALLIGGIGGWYLGSFVSNPAPQNQAQTGKLTLPPDAELFIPCINGHGAHYSRSQDLIEGQKGWVGPSYVVDERRGEVIGIEYHISVEALDKENTTIESTVQRILSGEDLGLLYDHKFPVFNVAYDSVDILRISGHPGLEKEHYDVHAWILPPDQHKDIICPQA
jgi:hypothetical protein